jgi:hypothetical protein
LLKAPGIQERHSDFPEIATLGNPFASELTPTAEKLGRRALQCRADAESPTILELRANPLEIAREYERPAIRGEQIEERLCLPKPGPMNAIALSQWYA